jgi:hypothetical protein
MAEQATQRDFKTVDIIDYSMQSKPTQVHDAFDQIITNKVVDGLETKKREVSARIFSDKEPEVEVQAEPEPETTETQ